MNVFDDNNEDMRIEQQQWLMLQVYLHIKKIMDSKGVTQTELAKRLGCNKSYVSQILNGANLSLKKISDVFLALDSSMVVDVAPVGFETTLVKLEPALKFCEYSLPEEEYIDDDMVDEKTAKRYACKLAI